jgi:hypothetical protein
MRAHCAATAWSPSASLRTRRALRYHRADTSTQEDFMASRAETLAKQCEARVQEALHQENATAAAAIVRVGR